ncbi:DUF559 domain-containing protein [Nocardioides bizhenqiangii]|uniref:DUF559 domain-containing protein n=1 Tax=Nocardioides bizhenqiangii TaxID=3095076 RepID=A0ABZ0ZM12_9ACTN|nr:DUF559 domain-containing protein [Nocardioides sp. HM61]WQQ25233.1 DUF559 domain-containing protein [Nocardioides sp. HM61]
MHATPPPHPFIRTDLPGLGITPRQLRNWVRTGLVRPVFYGGYVPDGVTDTIDMRAALVARLLPDGHIVSGRTAAWLYGVDTYVWAEGSGVPLIDVCVVTGSEPSDRVGVVGHTRALAPRDVTRLSGILVTTPLRTVMDLGCMLRMREAIAAMDALARLLGVTVAAMTDELPRYRRRRGVRQLRVLVPLVDPRSESARESWTRLEIHLAGLAPPTPQHWVVIDGIPTYRLDFAYPERRIAVEYDGYDAHERTEAMREHDRLRRRWLRANGWTVIVIRRGDFSGAALDRWLDQLRAALAPSYTPVRKLERGAARG